MPSKLRLQRIGDRIRQEMAEMIIKEISDPRLEGVMVNDVKVDRELAFADVFVSAVEGAVRSQEVLLGFERASGYIRHALAERVDLRVFPRLRFHWDPTPENADHVERLLAQLREESKAKPPSEEVD